MSDTSTLPVAENQLSKKKIIPYRYHMNHVISIIALKVRSYYS